MAEDLTLGGLLSALGGAELVRGDPSAGVLGIEHDSRQVDGGFLFVAVPGARVDGHVFLAEAAAGGATSLLVQRDRADQWSSLPTGPAIVAVDDTRRALSATASWFWGRPSASMKVIGITGTDGKSTTAHLMTTALQASGARVGRLSTVDILIPGQEGGAVGGRMTTPEATEVHRVLRLMVDAGTDFAIVESTSHGLALNRLDHVEYDVAVLTNITGDHLDFHETFEAYRDAKGRLFEMVSVRSEDGLGAAVVNADDPSANYLLGKASGVSKFRYGLDSEDVDVTARQVVLRAEGTQFSLVT
ncbi:MAG TPA: Mur ligase family protein, partial [Dehalococcoidia bacterium]|nr:Mur ligase family protein [Dehalococcoidia bacterium]